MVRDHNKEMRLMRNGKTFALDTLSGVEMLEVSRICIDEGLGNVNYLDKVSGIVRDAESGGRNFYVTLPMRRVMMGFIRPVFEDEWALRNMGILSTLGIE